MKVFEDNVLVKEALQTVPSGAVLVVDGGGSNRCALMGDRLATIAVERNLAGVIINGCIRDSAEINEMDLGVRGPAAPAPSKARKKEKASGTSPSPSPAFTGNQAGMLTPMKMALCSRTSH